GGAKLFAEGVGGGGGDGGGAPNCSSRMSCVAVCVDSVGSRNVSAPADWIIPLTRWKRFPITAPGRPCRGIGMEGSVIHEFVAGSYASTARNAPTSSVVVTSPPATKILRPSLPEAPPLRAVGILSFGMLHMLDAGLYSSTTSV